MANKTYIHVFGVVGVVVFAVVLALSVGAVFFAGNETALAEFSPTTMLSIDLPLQLLMYYDYGEVSNIGDSDLYFDLKSERNERYYFLNFSAVQSYFGSDISVTAEPVAYYVNFNITKVGTGSLLFYSFSTPAQTSYMGAALPNSSSTSRSCLGTNLRFSLGADASGLDSYITLTSLTLYYFENDRLYDSAYDSGYDSGYADGEDDGWREGYSEGFDSGVLEGISDGYEQGFIEGKEEGKQEGYDIGYADGIAKADEIISWSNSIPLSISSVTPYVDEVDNMHGYSVENSTVPDSAVPAIRVSRTAPPMLPACQISLGSTVPAQTVIEFRYENLLPRGLYSSGIYINFGALDPYGMYHYLTGSSTDSNSGGFTVSLPVDTQYIVVSTSQSADYMYLVGVSYRIAGRTAYDIGLNVGYETGYLDGVASINVENIKHNAYYEGFDDGVQSANEYTFTGLIGAAIDAPIKAFRGLFGFDVLGTNLANLALSLFTLSIILVVVKFVIKST